MFKCVVDVVNKSCVKLTKLILSPESNISFHKSALENRIKLFFAFGNSKYGASQQGMYVQW